MALLVVRLLGWALHLETGREDDSEETEEDAPTVVGGDTYDAGEARPGLGFVLPSTEWED